MRLLRLLLCAVGFVVIASVLLAPPASADNCDIFISPEDCQNTGWTIGVIATVAGGVAVATVAVTGAGTGTETPPPPALPLRRPPESRERRDHEPAAADFAITAVLDAPFTAVRPIGGDGRAHSIRLEAHLDRGWQDVREVPP